MRHARLQLTDDELDELHRLKRVLSRQQQRRVTLDDLLHRGVELVISYYQSIDETHGQEVQP